jgi:hypothetical protein
MIFVGIPIEAIEKLQFGFISRMCCISVTLLTFVGIAFFVGLKKAMMSVIKAQTKIVHTNT